jgi:Arc/MetJ family transcription regulator
VPTNLAIDDRLLNEALKLGGLGTKRETVNRALEEFVRHQKRLKALEAFGTIDFDPAWDYKAARRRRKVAATSARPAQSRRRRASH